tara:strand:+ start:1665 stop:2174 length:510 start_codon:yes stop_codon:yes gene_type:complete
MKVTEDLNKKVLLVFLGLLALFFVILFLAVADFMPDARLYPVVMSITGFVLALASVIRVLSGKEPTHEHNLIKVEVKSDARQDDAPADRSNREYRSALFYLAIICFFYVAIWLLGFRVATLVFVSGFMRYNKQSLVSCAVYAGLSLLLVEALSRLLGLVLPAGFWHLLF